MSNDNSLVRLNLDLALNTGSLDELMEVANDKPMLLIDVSDSMNTHITTVTAEGQRVQGDTRIEALRKVVTNIRGEVQVVMIAFGGESVTPRFVDNVPAASGGTPLHLAIALAKEYGATRLVVISDGAPDMAEQSKEEARKLGGRIDVIYIGDPGGYGEDFLLELAALTGGTRFDGKLSDPKQLGRGIIGLLTGGEDEAPQGEAFFSQDEDEEDDEDDNDEEDDDADDDDDEAGDDQ